MRLLSREAENPRILIVMSTVSSSNLEAQTVETQNVWSTSRTLSKRTFKFNRAVKKLYNEFPPMEYDKEPRKGLRKEIQEMVDAALAEER